MVVTVTVTVAVRLSASAIVTPVVPPLTAVTVNVPVPDAGETVAIAGSLPPTVNGPAPEAVNVADCPTAVSEIADGVTANCGIGDGLGVGVGVGVGTVGVGVDAGALGVGSGVVTKTGAGVGIAALALAPYSANQ